VRHDEIDDIALYMLAVSKRSILRQCSLFSQ